VLAVSLAVLGAPLLLFLFLPWPLTLRWREPIRTALMEYRAAQAAARGEPFQLRYTWVPLDSISRHLRRAVLVAEDSRFYEHDGIDWLALREELRYRGDASFSPFDPGDLRALASALHYYWDHRGEIRGRSTITQQLAKNLYFTPRRSVLRKVAEAIVAKRLEWFLPKDRILELYLNTAEWGPGIFGAEAAARHYFGRSAATLTREQAAMLAATLPHPLTSNPAHRPGRMRWRKNLILARMAARPGSAPPGRPAVKAALAADGPAGAAEGAPTDTARAKAGGPAEFPPPETAGPVPPDTTGTAPPDTTGNIPPDTTGTPPAEPAATPGPARPERLPGVTVTDFASAAP